jgi:hypothetical protein
MPCLEAYSLNVPISSKPIAGLQGRAATGADHCFQVSGGLNSCGDCCQGGRIYDFLMPSPGRTQSILYAGLTILPSHALHAPVRAGAIEQALEVDDDVSRLSLLVPGQCRGPFVMTPPSLTRGTSDYRVVVRRVAMGAVPYRWGWEVRGDGDTQVHISSDRFHDMETAYQAGKAWLGRRWVGFPRSTGQAARPYKIKARLTATV